jgi:hypothetical protein
MTRCKLCPLTPWKGPLCYRHYREANGFVFDPMRKLFIHTLPERRRLKVAGPRTAAQVAPGLRVSVAASEDRAAGLGGKIREPRGSRSPASPGQGNFAFSGGSPVSGIHGVP